MTQLWPAGQLITVAVDSSGTPVHFVWQEQRHAIGQIVQRWEIDLEWWRTEGRVWRDYLALITGDNLFCVIYYDRLRDEWRLMRLYD
jgi:hypothetical protein